MSPEPRLTADQHTFDETPDFATFVSELPTNGQDDYVNVVMQIHQQAMRVYASSLESYTAQSQPAGTAINGFATSTQAK
jgi:hypothetical protein